MPEYINPAGRILAVLEKLANTPNGNLKQLATCFGANQTDRIAILALLTDLRSEFALLQESIEQFQDNEQKFTLYAQNLPEVEKSIDSLVVLMANEQYQSHVEPTAVVAPRFIAADLPQEETPSTDELAQLRDMIGELQQFIEQSEELSRSIQNWLLDLVRLMRDGLDRYRIRGARGLRRQFHTMLGDLMDNYEFVQQVQKSKSPIWQKLCAAMDLMIKLSVLHEKYRPAIEVVRRAIPFWSDVAEDAGEP
jgi:hypothetical protein